MRLTDNFQNEIGFHGHLGCIRVFRSTGDRLAVIVRRGHESDLTGRRVFFGVVLLYETQTNVIITYYVSKTHFCFSATY